MQIDAMGNAGILPVKSRAFNPLSRGRPALVAAVAVPPETTPGAGRASPS